MKKHISDAASFSIRYELWLMLLFCFPLSAQLANEPTVVVAFNSPFSYSLAENISWELKDPDGNLVLANKGNVSGHLFAKPGSYILHIHEDRDHDTNACEHAHYPEKVNIQVKPTKVEFDFSSIQFSKDIPGGQSANGITVKVNVHFSSYDNSSAVYRLGFDSFGVGSTIAGKLKNNETLLKPGVNTLEFILEGQAETGNNIQLNFIDFNGAVQPYTLTPKVQ